MNKETKNHFDVIIVGGGIAGASLAYFLTGRGVGNVLILEREEEPGYHATGRSASVLSEMDNDPSVLGLVVIGGSFLRNPPKGFSENILLEKTGVLDLFDKEAWKTIDQTTSSLEGMGIKFEMLSPLQIVDKIPALEGKLFEGGLLLPENGRIDVHELLWSYLKHAKRRGAILKCNAEVTGVQVERGRVTGVITNTCEFQSKLVVNASGAWASRIGVLAGASSIDFTPMRRTIASFNAPGGIDITRWPFVVYEARQFYFAPESGGLLASPMDEEPMEPCDVKPDDLAVAQAMGKLEKLAPCLVPRSLRRKWAGLRTFAQDRKFVVGEDPKVKGFFWLCGQGGAGIQTSPAVGQIAADLILDGKTELIDQRLIEPSRFKLRLTEQN